MSCYQKILYFFLIAQSLFFYDISAITIGSDTAPNRFDTQQTLNNNDKIAGFAALAGGFVLSSGNSGIFDSFFQVSGSVGLNLGTLILNQDLILYNNSTLETLGNIIGQGHVLEFNCSTTLFPVIANNDGGSCSVAFAAQAVTNQNLPILSLDWSISDTFLAVGLGDTTGSTSATVEIWQWNGVGELTFKNSVLPNNKKHVECVRWHPTKGWLAVGTDNDPANDELFIYSVNWTTGALTLLSSAEIGGDVVSLAWHPSGNYLAVGTNKNSKEIQIFAVDGFGGLGTPVIIDNSNIDVNNNDGLSWDITTTYLAVGLVQSVANPEIKIFRFDPVPLGLTLIASLAISAGANAVDWSPTYSSILLVGKTGNVSVTTQIYNVDVALGAITLVGQVPNINKGTIAVNWNKFGGCFAIGTDTPNTNEFRVYSYNYSLNTATLTNTFDNANNIVSAVRWSGPTNSLASGGNDNIIYVYKNIYFDADPTNPNSPGAYNFCSQWSNICVVFNSDMILNDNCILFRGNSYIDGRGHMLTLTPNSRIFVDKNSTLSMNNITLNGINNHMIGAFDNSSTFSLNNVTWILDGNYTFTKGVLEVVGDFDIVGDGYVFAYQSQSVSNIEANGRLILENNLTFSYDPVTTNNNLIQMVANSSQLILHGATLASTSTGMRLTKGNVLVDRASYITNNATVQAEAMNFGDGISSANNVNIQILPAAGLDVLNGYVGFNNI